MDDCCNTHNSMAAGAGDRLYDGLFYSYPAGHCHYHCAGQSHSGAEARLEGGYNLTKGYESFLRR